MAMLTFSMPFVILAEQNPVKTEIETAASQDVYSVILEAKAHAERDASSDFNQPLWCTVGVGITALGIIGSLVGLAMGQAIDPPQGCAIVSTGMIVGTLAGYGLGVSASLYGIYNSGSQVPSARLIGKSPEYVRIYTSAYRRKTGSLRATRASAVPAITGLFLFGGILTGQ